MRYLCIGGYAVNCYGYHRATEDLDIWIAPTTENKKNFLNTMLCMGYSEDEIDNIRNEDFTTYFMCTLGARPNVIDILTIVHHKINFDDAENTMLAHKINDSIILKIVSYEFLKDIKSMRTKDLLDISHLENLRK